MNERREKNKRMITTALFCAIIVVMQLTGIGIINLPIAIKMTTLHIPVILGAILLGPKEGALFGGVFGICSIWANSTGGSVTAYVFSPFFSQEGFVGVLKSIWVALICRILLGLFAGFTWKFLKKIKFHKAIALPVTAIISTIFHTVIVLSSIYLLFPESQNKAYEGIIALIKIAVTGNGIFEVTAAMFVVTVLGLTLSKIYFKDSKEAE